jgi:hypothetical protein
MANLYGIRQSGTDVGRAQVPDDPLGQAKMLRLASKLVRLAPKPGALVYLDAAVVCARATDMQPMVFSAFDACTHLQIARMYLTPSFASAADFLDFIQHKFPFGISRIRTAAVEPYWIDPATSPVRRFTNHLEAQGILHALVDNRAQDDLFSVFDHLTFVHQAGSTHRPPVISQLVGELITFLYFHNNNRTMVSLNGKTPIEKLRTFPGHEEVMSFDPFASEPLRIESSPQPANDSQNAIKRISA